MEPRDMGQIWAKHYYKCRSNPDSRQICRLICSLVRAEASLKIGNLWARLAGILDEASIPIEQFDECEADAN